MGKTANYMQPVDLRKSRGCKMYGQLCLMHLREEPLEEEERKRILKEALKDALMKPSLEEALAEWDRFFDTRYGMLPGVIAKEQGDTQKVMGIRMMKWYYEAGYRTVSLNNSYSFLLKPGLIIKHTSDLLSEKNKRLVHFDLEWGENPYSDKARKPEAKTENSVELLCRLATNAKEDAGILYLKSKDDTGKKLAETFEAKPGKNVAYLPYSEDAPERLKASLMLPERMECTNCRKKNLCNAAPCAIRETGKKDKVISLSDIRLTETQELVVNHKDGPLCVVAVPGSGKTTALTVRLTRLIQSGVKPEKILMITFTNKACAEIADRVSRYVKGVQPDIFTFHGLAHAAIMEAEGESGELSHLETSTKRMKLINEALKRCPIIKGFSYDYREGEYGLLGRLSVLFKNIDLDGGSGIKPDDDRDGIMKVYEQYKKLYEEGNYFDYDYLIRHFRKLLFDSSIRSHFQEKYDYIMVDEVQDVDEDQWEIIRALTGKKENLVIVGDDDQNLYKWRGASSKFMLNFPMYYKRGKVLYMEDNFRSTRSINDAANAVIEGNDERYGKIIRSMNERRGCPVYYGDCFDLSSLAHAVKGLKFKPEEICVIGRTNAGLEKLKSVFEKEGIKCMGPRNYLIDSGAFGLMYGIISLYMNGTQTPEGTIYRFLRIMGKSPVKTEKGLYEDYIAHHLDERIEEAFDALENARSSEDAIVDAYRALTGTNGFSPELDALIKKAADEEAGTLEELFSTFTDMVRYGDDTEIEYSPMPGRINLLTNHKAKGKEFPCVIVAGTEDYDDTEEDRRLFYVAISRGKMSVMLMNLALKAAGLVEELKNKRLVTDIEGVIDREGALLFKGA